MDAAPETPPPPPSAIGRLLIVGALAAVPLLVVAAQLLGNGLADYAVDGDGALFELCVRNTCAGRQELGSYSRFGFNHPGPAVFRVCAPLYAATGETTASLNLSTVLLHTLASVGLVVGVGRALGTAAAVATATILNAYAFQLGHVLLAAWDPSMVLLTTAFALVAWARFGAGRDRWLIPAVVATSLNMQAQLTLLPPMVSAGGLAIVGRWLARRRTPFDRRTGLHVAGAALATAALWLPPLGEALGADGGNVAAIATRMAANEPVRSWGEAVVAASEPLSRFARTALGGIGPGGAAAAFALGQWLALVALALVAWRGLKTARAQPVALSFAAQLAVLHVAAVVATHTVPDRVIPPQVQLWPTTLGALTWAILVAFAAQRVVTRLARRVGPIGLATASVVTIAATAVPATLRLHTQTALFLAFPVTASRTPELESTAERVRAALGPRGRHGCDVEILNATSAPPAARFAMFAAPGLVLELERRGIPVRPDPASAFMYPSHRPTPDAPATTLVVFDAPVRADIAARPGVTTILDAGPWGVALVER